MNREQVSVETFGAWTGMPMDGGNVEVVGSNGGRLKCMETKYVEGTTAEGREGV